MDFLEEERVAFRLYYQDAVAAAPFGFVTDSLIRPEGEGRRRVDVAILVPATYAEVEWHPEAIVDNVWPRHILLGHWESFFRSPLEEPEPVPLTNLPHFIGRLERAIVSTFDERTGWHLPAAGARFLVR